ncbi:MAG: rhomboid family intramembrane serine protease [Flavobacteriales bacterium]|nr:rhomboid family intramembrane serine protease [Flavobacteriales bacterium]
MKTTKLIQQYWFPVFFPLLLIFIWYIEVSQGFDFSKYGVFPQKVQGLKGIFLMHFIHGDGEHLFNNSIPLLVLGLALFAFYKEVAYQVFIVSMLMSGLWVWVAGRPSYHIGASALIYALTAFLFTSGLLRKNIRLMAISLIVVFLYGSLIWGIFPTKPRISWEGHLYGMLAGIILAIYYRKIGTQREKYNWDDEDDEDDELEDRYWEEYFTEDFSNQNIKIVYRIKPEPNENKEE